MWQKSIEFIQDVNIKCNIRLNRSNMRNSIEYFTDVKSLTKFYKVISYSAEYITCEKIRPNFSHLYSPIMSLVKYSTNYVSREKFNDILHGCGKIDLIRTSCDILDRKRQMRKMRPNFSHLYSPKMCHLFDI